MLLTTCFGWTAPTWGQNKADPTPYGVITGLVSVDGQPAAGATLLAPGLNWHAVADQEGRFRIEPVPYGKYQIKVSYVGAAPYKDTIVVAQARQTLNLELDASAQVLSEVTISAESNSTLMELQPITVRSLEAKDMRGRSEGVAELLRQSTGVVVRRSGGLGSEAQVNLNGLTGNAVRIYYDGVPLEYFGGGVEINNLPLNLIERVDVYKGVMPIRVGTDALGGGINIVPRQSYVDYFEASYEVGSFNSHRLTAMGMKNLGEKIGLGIHAFANYSANNYLMYDTPSQAVRIFENQFGRLDTVTEESRIDARRFHDQHFSAYAEGQLMLRDYPWATALTLSSAYAHRYDDIQHGRQVTKRPAGAAYRKRQAFIQRLRYEHVLFKQLAIDYMGILSFTEENVRDSTDLIYDWSGNVLPLPNNRGSEILGRPTGRQGKHLGTTHRLNAGWAVSDRISLQASNFFAYARIQGEDPYGVRLDLEQGLVDPNTIPSTFYKNILGVEATTSWLEERLSAVIFYKHYSYEAESIDITRSTVDRIPTRINANQDNGYGLALKYALSKAAFLRANYERTLRIPTEQEIYGNFLFIIPNYNIAPERSDNVNLGLHWRKQWSSGKILTTDLNGFLRRQQNLIRLEVSGAGEVAQYINEAEADAYGIEWTVGATPFPRVNLNANLTYQKVTLAAADRLQNESFIGVQIPNIPQFFVNTSARYTLPAVLRKGDQVSVFWNYFFVDDFSITYVLDQKNANPDNVVPAQHQHDLGVSYRLPNDRLQFTFQVFNLADARLFDNFRVPKPGRHYRFKINFSI